MNNQGQKNPPGGGRKSVPTNPFARALAETEKSTYNNSKPNQAIPGSEQSPRESGGFNDLGSLSQKWQEQQLREQEKQLKREQLRKELHARINPVDNRELYDAREKQEKREIEELRKDLKGLVRDVAKFEKEVELTLMTETVATGQEGNYYKSFFQKLRAFIMLLRQKIHSAGTWATQVRSKKSKKGQKGMGLEGKSGHEQTKAVYDMMHHEVSNARSGG